MRSAPPELGPASAGLPAPGLVASVLLVVATLRRAGSRWVDSQRALWIAFVVTHGWLVLVGVVLMPRKAFFDLELYRTWVRAGLNGGSWPVFDAPFVYPVGALVPMLVPAAISTTSTVAFALGWCLLVVSLDAIAVHALARRGGARGAWWWLGFLVLLGPVAMGRLDAVVAPVVVVALLAAAARPRVAAAALTAAAWVKVAPGVLLIPLVLVVRRPLRDVVVPAALVCAGVVGAVAAGGGFPFVASFLTAQDSRGLQVEAVVASPWTLAALVRGDVWVVLNAELSTWEIVGPGTATAARALDVVLPLAVAGLALLIWRARHLSLSDRLVWGSLAMLTTLIVVNKVGSPQYIGWLAPPIAVALALAGGVPVRDRDGPLRALPRVAGAVWGIAALTQIVFPLAYARLLRGDVLITGVLVARNLALVAVLAGVIVVLARGDRLTDAARPEPLDEVPHHDDPAVRV
ncbi:MAG: hypothetical protein ACOH2F_05990 [Cellulomonas sp.]